MTFIGFRRLGLAVTAVIVVAACSSSTSTVSSPWSNQTSASNGGGMTALIAAARAEGQLNVIAVPREWVNYGAILDGFTAKYGIKINSANPNGYSADEIDAVKRQGKTSAAPDVLDLSMPVALANAALFAPYQVNSWSDIPAAQKDQGAAWYQDYGGYMSIGYDSTKVPALTSVLDLLGPAFKGKVALTGVPTRDDTALAAVMMAALANGGTPDNIGPGVDFFHQLGSKGNFQATPATTATVKSGQTPVVLNWDYLSVTHVADVPTWQTYIPLTEVPGNYYAQAINKNAPHPAAARLWEEYLYSDEGQNLWLKGGARPVRMQAMQAAGLLNAAAAAALPPATAAPVILTPAQASSAATYVQAHW
jgi:putative spermidine/putrescine transport system substrate-binding protein